MNKLLKYDLLLGPEDLSGNGYDAIGTLDFCYDDWLRCLINNKEAKKFFGEKFKILLKIRDIQESDKPQLICSNLSNAPFVNWAFYYHNNILILTLFEVQYAFNMLDKDVTLVLEKDKEKVTLSINDSVHSFNTNKLQEDTYTLYIDVGYSSFELISKFDCEPCKAKIDYLEVYSQ